MGTYECFSPSVTWLQAQVCVKIYAHFCLCLSVYVLQTRVFARIVTISRCLDVACGVALSRPLVSSLSLLKMCKWLKLGEDDSVPHSLLH